MGYIASLDIDAQKGFTPLCPNELAVADGHAIVDELNALAELAEFRLGSKDAHPANAHWAVASHSEMLQPLDLENADCTWVPHCVPGTYGFELIDGLPKPMEYDFFVWKGIEPDLHPYGVCYHDLANRRSTGILEFLATREIDTVLVGGLATDYCVKTTVLQLRHAGLRVIVNLAACRGIDSDTVAQALESMRIAGAELAADIEAVKELLSDDGSIKESGALTLE